MSLRKINQELTKLKEKPIENVTLNMINNDQFKHSCEITKNGNVKKFFITFPKYSSLRLLAKAESTMLDTFYYRFPSDSIHKQQ